MLKTALGLFLAILAPRIVAADDGGLERLASKLEQDRHIQMPDDQQVMVQQVSTFGHYHAQRDPSILSHPADSATPLQSSLIKPEGAERHQQPLEDIARAGPTTPSSAPEIVNSAAIHGPNEVEADHHRNAPTASQEHARDGDPSWRFTPINLTLNGTTTKIVPQAAIVPLRIDAEHFRDLLTFTASAQRLLDDDFQLSELDITALRALYPQHDWNEILQLADVLHRNQDDLDMYKSIKLALAWTHWQSAGATNFVSREAPSPSTDYASLAKQTPQVTLLACLDGTTHENRTECKLQKCMLEFYAPINITTIFPGLMLETASANEFAGSMDYFTHSTSLTDVHWGTTQGEKTYASMATTTTMRDGTPVETAVRNTLIPTHGPRPWYKGDNHIGAPSCWNAESCYTHCQSIANAKWYHLKKNWWKVALAAIGATLGAVGLVLAAFYGLRKWKSHRANKQGKDGPKPHSAKGAHHRNNSIPTVRVTSAKSDNDLATEETRAKGTFRRQAEEGRSSIDFATRPAANETHPEVSASEHTIVDAEQRPLGSQNVDVIDEQSTNVHTGGSLRDRQGN